MIEPKKPQYPIESVDNVLRLLLMFRDHRDLTVSAVASELGVAVSTAHRLLAMLRWRGFVTQESGSKAYSVGGTLLQLSMSVIRGYDLKAAAQPHLEGLSQRTGATAHLALLNGADVLFVAGAEPGTQLRVAVREGMALPAYATAAGKILLAHLEPEALERLLPSELPPVTPRTISLRTTLAHELDRSRERGYAMNEGESELDVRSIAVPVDGQSTALGALAISFPAFKLMDSHIPPLVEELRITANAIGESLGR